jgi:hypothetical protein
MAASAMSARRSGSSPGFIQGRLTGAAWFWPPKAPAAGGVGLAVWVGGVGVVAGGAGV